MYFYFWYFKYILLLILLYFYLSNILNARLLLVKEYSYTLVLLLLIKYTLFVFLPPLNVFTYLSGHVHHGSNYQSAEWELPHPEGAPAGHSGLSEKTHPAETRVFMRDPEAGLCERLEHNSQQRLCDPRVLQPALRGQAVPAGGPAGPNPGVLPKR